MNDIYRLKLIKGSQGLYYIIDGKEDVGIDSRFPLEWIVRDLCEKRGINCNICLERGFFNGVMVSYCMECLMVLRSEGKKCGCLCIYNITSGENEKNGVEYPCDDDECCFKTYLKGVHPWEIGDRSLFEKKGSEYIFIGSEKDIEVGEDIIFAEDDI